MRATRSHAPGKIRNPLLPRRTQSTERTKAAMKVELRLEVPCRDTARRSQHPLSRFCQLKLRTPGENRNVAFEIVKDQRTHAGIPTSRARPWHRSKVAGSRRHPPAIEPCRSCSRRCATLPSGARSIRSIRPATLVPAICTSNHSSVCRTSGGEQSASPPENPATAAISLLQIQAPADSRPESQPAARSSRNSCINSSSLFVLPRRTES